MMKANNSFPCCGGRVLAYDEACGFCGKAPRDRGVVNMTADAIKRYDIAWNDEFREDSTGEVVLYDDIAPTLAEVAALREALEPFVKFSSSEEWIKIAVKTADIERARALLNRAAGEGK
jgi:hypothetical protein